MYLFLIASAICVVLFVPFLFLAGSGDEPQDES